MQSNNLGKIKLLKIWEILNKETDESHPISTPALIQRLEECGISVSRKILYGDIELLNQCGYEIMCHRSTSNEYYVADRSFDMPELQILMDAVQAAGFITRKKTAELIGKIAQLAGSKRAEVIKSNRVEFLTPKSDNEKIYYSVDTIADAIDRRKQISFTYFDYDLHHKKVYRKDKMRYVVNPLATVFVSDNYYLMCCDDKHDGISHYRIDRMDAVEICDTDVTKTVTEAELVRHKKQLFGMFKGEGEKVTFQADKSIVDYIFEKFGSDVVIVGGKDNTVTFNAEVQISKPFLAWCCSFGTMLKVLAPLDVTNKLKEYLSNLVGLYE